MTIGVLSILRASLVFATVAAVACPADAQVVCLGASNTAGKGVSQQEAYPAQLEIMLRARHYDGGVANAGSAATPHGECSIASRVLCQSARGWSSYSPGATTSGMEQRAGAMPIFRRSSNGSGPVRSR